MGDFDRYQAVSFDCYGTLIDWERGIADELGAWARGQGIAARDEELIEVFAGLETGIQRDRPTMRYPDVLAATIAGIATHYGVTVSDADAASFGGSVGRWPCFTDSVTSLARLKERFKLIILSNVDAESFRATNRLLGVDFDLIVTADDVGAYKPSVRSFPALLGRLGSIDVERSELVHVAQSLYHDHEPAQAVGLPSVWIDRRHDRAGHGATPPPRSAVTPDWRFASMAEFAAVATTTAGR